MSSSDTLVIDRACAVAEAIARRLGHAPTLELVGTLFGALLLADQLHEGLEGVAAELANRPARTD